MKAMGRTVVMGTLGLAVIGVALSTGGVGEPAALHAALMRVEERLPAGSETATPVDGFVANIDEAVAARNISAAVMAWRSAYGAALESRRGEPLVAVGDAALRIADIATVRHGFEREAREVYLAAHVRARRLESPEGAMRVAEAFARVGDHEAAQHLRRSAERMASARRP